MGVTALWQTLKKVGAVKQLSGRDEHAEIVAECDGKVVAVDSSTWLFQAMTQQALTDVFFTNEAVVCKVFFERVRNA